MALTFCSQCTPAPRGPQTAAQWDQWSAQTREAFQPPPSYVQSSLCVRVCVCGEGCAEGGVSVCVWLLGVGAITMHVHVCVHVWMHSESWHEL